MAGEPTTLTIEPVYTAIEVGVNEDGKLWLDVSTRAWVSNVPVDLRFVQQTTVTPEEWTGDEWDTLMAGKVEDAYVDAGYVYPA